MKTQDEIADYLKNDPSGAITQALIIYLDYEHAKAFIDYRTTPELWAPPIPLEKDYVEARLREALEKGWKKALEHNGVGANRISITVRSLLWLLDDEAALAFVGRDENYPFYGVPSLHLLSGRYAVEIPDDVKLERMRFALPCVDDCPRCGLETTAGR